MLPQTFYRDQQDCVLWSLLGDGRVVFGPDSAGLANGAVVEYTVVVDNGGVHAFLWRIFMDSCLWRKAHMGQSLPAAHSAAMLAYFAAWEDAHQKPGP